MHGSRLSTRVDQLSISGGTKSWLNELSTRHVVRRECSCVDSNLGEMVRFTVRIDPETEFPDARFDRLNQLLHQGTLDTGPIGDFVYDNFAVLVQKLVRRPNRLLAPLRYIKNIYQI